MTDPANYRLSRSPTGAMTRPAVSPMGPRTRFQRSLSDFTSRDSLMSITDPSPAYPSSPARSDTGSLPPIAEIVVVTPPQPPLTVTSSSSRSSPTPPPIYKAPIAPKPATLEKAPTLSFESVPIQWKALPHEAALWTLEKRELQEIVSRALRRSAPETYIRLLSLENLDKVLPDEVERLTSLKAQKQSRYRFLVQRRTMTLQALNSSFISPEKAEADDGIPTASKLAHQLSQTTAACDELMCELLSINDQLAQISALIEHHSASALAVALRKLNKSYAKRTQEVLGARQRISELEADLDDAWKEAERLAREMDEMQANADLALDGDEMDDKEEDDDHDDVDMEDMEEAEVAVIETAEKFQIRSRHASHIPTELLIQSRRNTGHMEGLPMFSPLSPMPRISAIAPPSPVPLEAPVAPDSQLVAPPSQDKDKDKDDAASIRSTKSTRSVRSARSVKSTRSIRSPDGTRLSLVSAARTRSTRASGGGLRLSRRKTSEHPPMPDLPLEFIATAPSRTSLHPLYKDSESRISSGRSRRTSLNDLLQPSRASIASIAQTVTMDDIYIRLQSQITHRSEDEIEVVRRTPVPSPRESAQASTNIPNLWIMDEEDVPPKPAGTDRFLSLKRPGNPIETYKRIKSYTKRYSLPFPLFKRSASSSSPTAEVRSVTSSRSAPTHLS
ncbi:hypothetical protein H0H87_010323 [Tephrocybe sp. NHM501043]|nr:hypothetical protein H0H87_010323 [Tephrocybe sp. NHM501043]